MSENNENQQTQEHRSHFVKTISKMIYLLTSHLSETNKETLQDKLKRMFLRDIQGGNC